MPVAISALNIVYEILCLGLTIVKTFRLYWEQRRVGMRTSFSKLLLRDGQYSMFPACKRLSLIVTITWQGFRTLRKEADVDEYFL